MVLSASRENVLFEPILKFTLISAEQNKECIA